MIARSDDGAALLSVVTLVDGATRHRYRIVGGEHDGAEFATLGEVASYATVHGIEFTDAG